LLVPWVTKPARDSSTQTDHSSHDFRKPDRKTEPNEDKIVADGTQVEEPLPDEALAAIRNVLDDIKAQLPALVASNAVKAEIHADMTGEESYRLTSAFVKSPRRPQSLKY
jgi:hypothetical protein